MRIGIMRAAALIIAMSMSVAANCPLADAASLDCPASIQVKADRPPPPWSYPLHNYTLLRFAHTSMSCVAGSCTLACSYVMYPSCNEGTASDSYNFLVFRAPPGACQYKADGRGFDCRSLAHH
jgi:hypothetical protein